MIAFLRTVLETALWAEMLASTVVILVMFATLMGLATMLG